MKILKKGRKVKYVYNSISGLFSFKEKKQIWYESNLEKNFLHMISFSDSVMDIESQPFTIEYRHEGKLRKYTPDFLVFFKPNGDESHPKPLLVEVKRREELLKKFSEFKPKFKAGSRHAFDEGYHFKIYDERRIYGPYYENITYLQSFSRSMCDEQELKRITDYLSAIGHTSISNIVSYLYKTEEEAMIGLRHIYQLLLRKAITADLQKPISNNTVICNSLEY